MLIRRAENGEQSPIGDVAQWGLVGSRPLYVSTRGEWTVETFRIVYGRNARNNYKTN